MKKENEFLKVVMNDKYFMTLHGNQYVYLTKCYKQHILSDFKNDFTKRQDLRDIIHILKLDNIQPYNHQKMIQILDEYFKDQLL